MSKSLDCSIGVVREVEAEKAGGIAVKGDLIVPAYVSYDRVNVGRGVAEYEGVVDVYNYVGCLGRGGPVE